MSNPTPILNNINAFDATKGTTISFNIIGGTDIVRSNIVYIYDLSTNDLICTHLYISTESIHELPPNTDSSIVYASGKSSADFVNNKNYYLQIQTFTNTAGTTGGSGMSVAKTFWCLFNPALSVNAIPAAISTTSYNVGATYTTNITDVTIPVTNIIQQYKFDLYTATGALVQTSGNIIGSGEQEGASTTYNITYNFSGLVVNNSYYVVVTTTSTEGMTVSAQSNTFTVSIDTPTVGGAIVNNNACDGYISVVSNLSDEYGGSASGEMASFETDSVNNVSSLKVNMEPIQDLHGYDKPWVGGVGKNKLSTKTYSGIPYNPASGSAIEPTVKDTQWSDNGDGTFSLTLASWESASLVSAPLSAGQYTIRATTVSAGMRVGIYVVNADGTLNRISQIKNGTTANELVSASTTLTEGQWFAFYLAGGSGVCTIKEPQLETGSTATSYAPYSNICPISGCDSVSANVVGKNIFGGRAFADGIKTAIPQAVLNTDAKTISYASGYATLTSNFTSGVRFKKNTQYTIILKFSNTVDRTNMLVAYTDGTSTIIRTSGTGLQTIIFTSATNKTINYIGGSNNNGTSVFYYEECGVFEGVLTADQFEPYDGTTYHQDIEATYTPTVQENEPYQFKRTGDVGGDRESIELVGGTVAWNQLANNDHVPTSRNGVTFERHDDYFTMDGTATSILSASGWFGLTSEVSKKLSGHKVLIDFQLIDGTASDTTFVEFYVNGRATSRLTLGTRKVIQCDTSTNHSELDISNGTVLTNVKARLQVIDLTAMFNPTIADYIYSLEQSQAGAGVAWFRNYFPKDYYPYEPGTLRSVEGVSAHETVGFNQWDEETLNGYYDTNGLFHSYSSNLACKNLINVKPNATYHLHCGYARAGFGRICFYDSGSNCISTRNISGSIEYDATMPENCHYFAFDLQSVYGTTYNHDICINLSDPSRNGEYEPYQKHTYPLDSSLTLRGVPKLVDGKLEFDGDVYPPSGEVQRRYGLVDLGTLDWRAITASSSRTRFRSADLEQLAKKVPSLSAKANALCSCFELVDYSTGNGQVVTGVFALDTDADLSIWVSDSTYADATAFKTAMSGHTLVYELATPTTETADPFESIQKVTPNYGTEEFVTTSIVPVGNNTQYYTREVYGGTLDLVTGVLTVDRKMVDLGDTTWNYNSTYLCWVTSAIAGIVKKYPTQAEMITAIAEKYVVDSVGILNGANFTTGKFILGTSGNLFVKTGSDSETPTGLFCYELAQPQTYQLTPHQIQTLVGQNNVWSDAGDVEVTFNLPITNLLVKRQDTSDTSGKWLTLYSQPITQASDMDFTFIDFLNQHGKTYRYALVPLLTQQQGDIDVEIEGGYTVSDDVLSVFDGVFVANSNGSQKLKAATEYGDLETNQDVGVLTTIGGKYPFVVSNSNLNYHSGSISALIVPSDFYTSGDLDRLSIVERREAIEQFLTDKTAKVLKDWNGNIWLITFVENVEVSFVDDYGMGLGTLSAKWVEIGDVNDQTDLQQTGLI